MAIALKEGRPIRGAEAIAERPDGTQIRFAPYPTPLTDASGRITGAINLPVVITEQNRNELEHDKLAAIVTASDDAIIARPLMDASLRGMPLRRGCSVTRRTR